jgi:glutaredoxin 3
MYMPTAIVYTAPECPHSKKLKEFLKELGVEIEEKDVLSSLGLFDELQKISGQEAVPVTVIADDIFVGFDRRAERRIKRAVGG